MSAGNSDTGVDGKDIDLSFDSDVMESIQRSLSLNKSLMLFIRNEGVPLADDESQRWIDRLIFHNSTLSEPSRRLLSTDFIRLEISRNSADFQNLVSIMPVFQNSVTPCLFFIFSGQIIDAVPNNVDTSTFEEKIIQIHTNVARLNQQPSVGSANTTVPSPPVQQQNLRQTASSTPLSQIPISNPNPNVRAPVKNERKSLKEESAELAARKYREDLLKKQKQEKMDRERILRLLELDRQELKNRGKKPATNKDSDDKECEPIHENIHNSKLQNSETYTVQLKLFDGKTIRQNFRSTEKLTDVRSFVLRTYPDYNSLPFYFFKTVDRRTYFEADENKSLALLNLNMSTLILKPIEPEETSNITMAHEYPQSSSFGWLRKKMSSYLWPDNKSDNDHSDVPPSSTLHRENSFPSSVQHSLLDEESDTDTLYHTPLLTSTNSSLRPILSSFNLYGSQNLIPPSSNTSSILDLHDMPSTDDAETLAAPNTRSENETSGTSNTSDRKSYSVRNEEMDVQNGNNISLQFPEDH